MSVFCHHSPLRLVWQKGRLFHSSWTSSTFIHGYPVASRLHLIPLYLVPVVQLWHQNTERHQQIQNWPMRFLLKSFHNSILNQTYTLSSWGQRFPTSWVTCPDLQHPLRKGICSLVQPKPQLMAGAPCSITCQYQEEFDTIPLKLPLQQWETALKSSLNPHVALKRLIWGPKHIAPGVASPAPSRGTKCLPWPASCALPPGLFQVLFYRPLIQSVPSLWRCMGLFYPRNKTSTLYSMLSFMRLILTQQTNFSRSLSNEGPLFGLASTAPFP